MKYLLIIVAILTLGSCSKKTQPVETEVQEDIQAEEIGEIPPPPPPPPFPPVTEEINDDDIFEIVEEVPEYPGGEQERTKFISKNLVYPKKAIKEGIQGVVYVQFIVEKDGSLSNLKIVKSLGHGCDEEVIRVMKLMPKWIPGKQRGKAVRVKVIQPVKFTLK